MFNKLLVKIVQPANLAVLLIAGACLVFVGFVPAPEGYHSRVSKWAYRASGLSEASGQYMGASGLCVNCHNTDPNGQALVDANGHDVSPVNDWRATIMANSAKDPFWIAKVRHEILETPSLESEIENTCTSCHAPQGFAEFHMTGQGSHYTLDVLFDDELGLDGVGCIGCHSIENEGLASAFNGNQPYSDQKIAYGTFTQPWASPMIAQSGFAPVFGAHMESSELCAGCHSLFVQTVDLEGNYTGVTFFEQATYHEWLNSDFKTEGIECQGCHMPKIEGVKVATQPNWLQPRPFGKHLLVGGNTFMLKMMRDNAELLGITASTDQFNTVIERTEALLQNESLEMNVQQLETMNDTATFYVHLTNLAGHKFPSGYPSRLLHIEVHIADENGNTLFHSGGFNADFEINGRDEGWEPHYDVITSDDQVQIYEMVFADVEGTPTTVLERAHTLIKDNRLVPRGFTTAHAAYDTTRIGGLAESDPNFNRLNGTEGSGSDRIEYRVATGGYVGPIDVTVRAWYQSMPPRWMEDMFAWDDPEINGFRELYNAADQSPVLVAEHAFGSVVTVGEIHDNQPIRIAPNPTFTGWVHATLPLTVNQQTEYAVYRLNGQRVSDFKALRSEHLFIAEESGTYLLVIRNGDAIRTQRIIVIQ
jgi:hypothetical protein